MTETPAGLPGTAPPVPIPPPGVVRNDASEDIVEVWGLGSFPASDPPSNW